MTLYRDVGDGLFEMNCTLHIDVNILKDQASIPYKYVVYSSSTERNEKPHEFLYGAEGRGEIVNRCLMIPAQNFCPGGKHVNVCAYFTGFIIIVLLYSRSFPTI